MKKNDPLSDSKKTYYQRHKNEAEFKEHRRKWAQDYRDIHPEVKKYQKEYAKKYYAANRKELNAKRKLYPDKKRNERVNRFKQKERNTLGKNYIIQIITRTGKIKKQDVTPYMIIKRRKQIQQKRLTRNK
ncbi:MAG: hypothetical protein ABJB05_05365 [Parafilimonas sp.]